ncbi:MAG: hypothetical protein ACOCUT_03250, partial [bacterium]
SFENNKSLVIFARGGKHPLFAAMRFKVGTSTKLWANTYPHLFPLLKLKQTYQHYLLVILYPHKTHYLEFDLGDMTESIWKKDWGQDIITDNKKMVEELPYYYQVQSDYFLEKLKTINCIMGKDHLHHLILAGNKDLIEQLSSYLPTHLTDQLAETITIPSSQKPEQEKVIIQKALNAFIEEEKSEALAILEVLKQELKQGIAVTGHSKTLEALNDNLVDTLVLSEDFRRYEQKEILIKIALKNHVKIEIITPNNYLKNHGNVGCLLDYLKVNQIEKIDKGKVEESISA